MKQLPSATTLLIYALLTLNLSTNLMAEIYGDLTYEIDGDSITITDCDENALGLLIIPAVIEGKPVTTIGRNAFNKCDQLTSVTIPGSVISLDRVTFNGCDSLMSIDVDAANHNFSSLDGVLFNKSQSKLIQYPAGIIGSYTIPDTVTAIGEFAFAHSYHLNSVTISSSVDTIENGVFLSCISLTSATFDGDAPVNFGIRIFSPSATDFTVYFYEGAIGFTEPEWEGYTSVMIPAALTYEVDGDSITITDCDENAPGLLNIPAVIEGRPVATIGDSAFRDCTSLTGVVIPDSVISVGDYSFEGCSSLASATFRGNAPGTSRTRLGRDAFRATAADFTVYFYEGAIGFTEPEWEDHYTVMIPAALSYEVTSGSITITDCEVSASGELNIPALIHGKPVTIIGDSAFSDCSSLTSATVPDSVTTIGNSAFSNCINLTSVTFNGDAPSSVGFLLFDNTAINFTLYFYESAIGFTEPTWQGYSSISLPDALDYLDYEVNDERITITDCRLNASGDLVIPAVIEGKPVTTIGQNAFDDCDELMNVTIPDSVTTIGYAAFQSCNSLINVIIPDSVTSISEWAFSYCGNLTNVTIPDSITSIESAVFFYCSGLTNVRIPDSVTSIGHSAFYGCSGLTNVRIPDSVTSIENSVFHNCESLTNVTIPNSVTSIGEWAFRNCSRLANATIGSSVTAIENQAFRYCPSLSRVTFNGDAPSRIGYSAFGSTAPDFTIYFYEDAVNFTTPTWQGYPSEELSLAGDDDGDNWPNHLERLLGTSPVDGNSSFKTWLSQSETGLQIHHAPYSDACEFVVESTTDLSDPESWQVVEGLSFSGDTTEQSAELSTEGEPAVFYRVSVNEIE